MLGQESVVSAHVQAFGGHAPGVQVVFSELLPDGEWEIFDIEHLPMVESDDQHFVRATYRPETCGTREILVEAFMGSRMRTDDWTTIHVACKDGLELVCHRGRTIEASGAALAAHVRHGDSVGACP
jgi:hypothetical protein